MTDTPTDISASELLKAIARYLQGLEPNLLTITITYSGGGDSGQTDSMSYGIFEPNMMETTGQSESIDKALSDPIPEELWDLYISLRLSGITPSPSTLALTSLESLIDDLAWDVAYGLHPGFEVNEGGQGSVILRYSNNKWTGIVDHETNYISTECVTRSF
jgi:hypothetical protein